MFYYKAPDQLKTDSLSFARKWIFCCLFIIIDFLNKTQITWASSALYWSSEGITTKH